MVNSLLLREKGREREGGGGGGGGERHCKPFMLR